MKATDPRTYFVPREEAGQTLEGLLSDLVCDDLQEVDRSSLELRTSFFVDADNNDDAEQVLDDHFFEVELNVWVEEFPTTGRNYLDIPVGTIRINLFDGDGRDFGTLAVHAIYTFEGLQGLSIFNRLDVPGYRVTGTIGCCLGGK